MAERKGDMEQGDDRGTKAEQGIGREEAEGQDRGTKDEHGYRTQDAAGQDRSPKASTA